MASLKQKGHGLEHPWPNSPVPGSSVTDARSKNKSKKIQSPSALFASAAQTPLVYHTRHHMSRKIDLFPCET